MTHGTRDSQTSSRYSRERAGDGGGTDLEKKKIIYFFFHLSPLFLPSLPALQLSFFNYCYYYFWHAWVGVAEYVPFFLCRDTCLIGSLFWLVGLGRSWIWAGLHVCGTGVFHLQHVQTLLRYTATGYNYRTLVWCSHGLNGTVPLYPGVANRRLLRQKYVPPAER